MEHQSYGAVRWIDYSIPTAALFRFYSTVTDFSRLRGLPPLSLENL